MLVKGTIKKGIYYRDQFLSHIFLVSKKKGGQWPVLNMKELNTLISYKHFKIEELHLIKKILEQGDYLWKLDLKDVFFCVPLNKHSRKYVRFEWEGSLYEFLSLCFGFGSVPRLFTKLLKIPISTFRKLHIRTKVYLDDILILRKTLEKNNFWDLPVTKCRICYKPKEISSSAKTENKFLGITIDSVAASGEYRFDFEKVSGYVVNQEVSIKSLAKLLGILSLRYPAEKTNPQPLFEQRLQQQSSSRST